MKPRSAQQRRQSSQPGAGKGRKEVVRGSGVYPGSGPYPPGKAKVETPASFVHHLPEGARGASRGARTGQSRAGGRATAGRTGPHRALATEIKQYPYEVDSEEWKGFLDDFSRAHDGWESEIRVFQPDQSGRIETHGLPLEGISLDYKANECTTTVSAGTDTSDHLQRLVPRTTRIIALNRDELEIDAADRSRTFVRCRRQGR